MPNIIIGKRPVNNSQIHSPLDTLLVKVTKADEEIASKAVSMSVRRYPIIRPNYGTIGFFIKKLRLNPIDIMVIIDSSILDSKKDRILINVVNRWNLLDDNSKLRFDVLDQIAFDLKMSAKNLWILIMPRLVSFADQTVEVAQLLLQLMQMDVVDSVRANLANNNKDRRLGAQITGLIKNEAPNINVNTNIANMGEPTTFRSFSKTVNKALTEGDPDYIDVEYVMEDEREKETA